MEKLAFALEQVPVENQSARASLEERIAHIKEVPVSYTHLDVYKRQAKTMVDPSLSAQVLAKEGWNPGVLGLSLIHISQY